MAGQNLLSLLFWFTLYKSLETSINTIDLRVKWNVNHHPQFYISNVKPALQILHRFYRYNTNLVPLAPSPS